MQTFTYGNLTIDVEGESISEFNASTLGRAMAHVDALLVYEQMVKYDPTFKPDNMFMTAAFKPAQRMLNGAKLTLANLSIPFATNGAEHIFVTTYLHEFFGTFVAMLHARSLSVYTI